MSGRAYARNPDGTLNGATDVYSFVPHRFRIEAPVVMNKTKDLAIRRAIQLRCKEKNWKKLLRMRHTRLVPLVSSAEDQALAVENGVGEDDKLMETTTEKSENVEETVLKDVINGQENGGHAVVDDATPKSVVTEQQQQHEALEKAKQRLQEIEEKLATLSEEKHAKFQQLKEILIAEARSKMVPSMPKKRRVDSLGSTGTSSSPRLVGASGNVEGAGLSLLGAPSPSLLRAKSFSGPTGLSSGDLTLHDETRRQGGLDRNG